MEHQLFIYNEAVDLSSDETAQTAGASIVKMATPIIDNIILMVSENNFDYSKFPLEKQQNSSLTKKIGLYLLINSKTKRIYLGSTSNLSQRKGDHHRCLNNPTLPRPLWGMGTAASKLAASIRDDLFLGKSTDFFFVPLLIIDNIYGGSATEKQTSNQKVSNFLDTYVEGPLLTNYLASKPDIFYNVKTVGAFETGNTFGGSPTSGSPSKPVTYGDYAWESVSAAAKSFNVDTKLIRFKINKGKMFYLNQLEYNSFKKIKISNSEASTYFADKLEEYNKLLKELFPRFAKKK